MEIMRPQVQLMDTTLRDGEQTQGVSFTPDEKVSIAKALLQSLNVDRIEVASARVSLGEKQAVSSLMQWAEQEQVADRIEILGFVDHTKSVDWITSSGAKVINYSPKAVKNTVPNSSEKPLLNILPMSGKRFITQ